MVARDTTHAVEGTDGRGITCLLYELRSREKFVYEV